MDARRGLAAFAVAIVAAAIAVWAGSIQADGPSPAALVSSRERLPAPATALSMSTCMGATCHGGAVEPQNEAWKSSYTAWFTRDPHAKAYNDLFNARSRRMIARLEYRMAANDDANRQDAEVQPYLAALERHGCLACHANRTGHSDESLVATSLGCHDCHGQDRGWVDQHYLTHWSKRPEAEQRKFGMQPTKDLVGRAQVCVGCHIGAPATDVTPLRDMNHDLIAAGHPRLNFEFAAYLANLPPHWDEAKDRQRLAKVYTNVEAEMWLTGQEVSGTAALLLLIDRAERAAGGGAGPRVWPEFSEYDCYGCHHQLAAPTRRPTDQRKPGQWQWGTWHFALAREANPTLSRLIRGMQQSAGPEAIPALAYAVRMEVPRPQTGDSLAELVTRLSSTEMDNWHWDQYAQWYLGLRALQAAGHEVQLHRNEDAAPPQQQLDRLREIDRLLGEIEAKLKFSGHTDSPWDFDPGDAQWKQLVDEVRQLLPALVPAASN